ncbi:MAG: hypothetical protein HYT61_02735 [Candidatus Yanofskybacteria bacterium]|nr:hypothetical protein [Candidatus Yanofskybacteria bacterium]
MDSDESTDLINWAHVKHISEISREDQEKAFEIRDKINLILETCLLLPAEETKLQIKQVANLRKEIEKLGFFINIEYAEDDYKRLIATIRLYTLKCKTEIVN